MFQIVVFILFLSVSFSAAASRPAPIPATGFQAAYLVVPVDDPLVEAAGLSFAEEIRKENAAWYECGKATPREEFDARGLQIALALRVALLEVGLEDASHLWGLIGIVYHESRGNPCVTGPLSRVWATDKGVGSSVHWSRYSEEDIFRIVNSAAFKKKRSGIDSGIAQTLYPRNARIYDAHTQEVRPATIEEMVTVEGSARAAAYHLFEQSIRNSQYPWAFWPGSLSVTYATKIALHVRRMGGPHREMIPRCSKTN